MGQSILFCQCLKGGCGNKTHSHSLILSKWQRNKRIGPWNEPQWEPLIAVGWGRTISTCDLDLGGFSVRNSSFFFFVKPAYIFKFLETKGCPSFFWTWCDTVCSASHEKGSWLQKTEDIMAWIQSSESLVSIFLFFSSSSFIFLPFLFPLIYFGVLSPKLHSHILNLINLI